MNQENYKAYTNPNSLKKGCDSRHNNDDGPLSELTEKDLYISNIITKMGPKIFEYLKVTSEKETHVIYPAQFVPEENYLPDGTPTIFNPYNQISFGFTPKYGKTVRISAGFLEFCLCTKEKYNEVNMNNGGLKLPSYIKDKIDTFLNNDKYSKYNINLNKGLLIYGKPGNGKTNILRYIQSLHPQESDMIRDSEIKNESWRLTASKYQLYDDIDLKIFEEDNPLYNTVISMMDSCTKEKYVRIFTTNSNIENISPAVLRPGRISLTMEVVSPFYEDRLNFFEDIPESEHIAKLTDGYTFAELNFFKVCLVDCNFVIEDAQKMYKDRILISAKKKVGF